MNIQRAWVKKCRQVFSCRPCGKDIAAEERHYLCHGWITVGRVHYRKFRLCFPCMLALKFQELAHRYNEEQFFAWRRERLHEGFDPYVLVIPADRKEIPLPRSSWFDPSLATQLSDAAKKNVFIPGRDYEAVTLHAGGSPSFGDQPSWLTRTDDVSTLVGVWHAAFELWLMMEHDWVFQGKKLARADQVMAMLKQDLNPPVRAKKDQWTIGFDPAKNTTYHKDHWAARAANYKHGALGDLDGDLPEVPLTGREVQALFHTELVDYSRPAPKRIPPKKLSPKRSY